MGYSQSTTNLLIQRIQHIVLVEYVQCHAQHRMHVDGSIGKQT